MSWRKTFTDNIGDVLRFIAYFFLAFDLIVLAIFTLWLTSKLVWFSLNFLNRTAFSHPW
jgi:hypothetical protein